MLDHISLRDIRWLAATEGICVSIYLPANPLGKARQEAPIRLKNQIALAHEKLVELGVRATHAHRLLEPAAKLLDDDKFWMAQDHGLALFLADGVAKKWRLPCDVAELTVVGKHFHIRPLLSVAEEAGFYVLAISEENVRLLHSLRGAVEAVHVADLPENLTEAIGPNTSEKQRQMHTVGHQSRMGTVSHGTGDRGTEHKNRLLRMCQVVNHALTRHLSNSTLPLVLAADEPIMSIYPSVNTYPHLLDETLPGCPRRVPDTELAQAAESIVSEVRREAMRELLRRYTQMKAQGMTENRIEDLVPDAKCGKVAVLFTDANALRWGLVDLEGSAHTVESPKAGAEDLINLAAIETLRNSGSVYETEDERLIELSGAAGILRY